MCSELSTQQKNELRSIAMKMVRANRGILAADEATKNFNPKLETIGVAPTEENRRRWRQALIEIPDLGDYICGVILNRETIEQKHDNGKFLREILRSKDIVYGVTLDFGPVTLHGGLPGEMSTQGLDDLDSRCAKYKQMGAGFAKWRAVYTINSKTGAPSQLTITENAMTLARYAAVCQAHGIVPIVEPDVVMAGDHDLDKNGQVCRKVWSSLFKALSDFNIYLPGVVLKTNMVISGLSCPKTYTPEDIAEYTLRVLGDTVPPSVGGIVFLSGGQSEAKATINLDAINRNTPEYGKAPWRLTFCYGRALQDTAFKAWSGKNENVKLLQTKLMERAKANSLASQGKYSSSQR